MRTSGADPARSWRCQAFQAARGAHCTAQQAAADGPGPVSRRERCQSGAERRLSTRTCSTRLRVAFDEPGTQCGARFCNLRCEPSCSLRRSLRGGSLRRGAGVQVAHETWTRVNARSTHAHASGSSKRRTCKRRLCVCSEALLQGYHTPLLRLLLRTSSKAATKPRVARLCLTPGCPSWRHGTRTAVPNRLPVASTLKRRAPRGACRGLRAVRRRLPTTPAASTRRQQARAGNGARGHARRHPWLRRLNGMKGASPTFCASRTH